MIEEMDTLLLLKGIIAAGQERRFVNLTTNDMQVPLSLLMRAADEIAQYRDLRHALVKSKGEDIMPYTNGTEVEKATRVPQAV